MAERLGETDPAANAATVRDLLQGLTRDGDELRPFADFQAEVGRAAFGIVFTAHPTFALSAPLLRIQAELATGHNVTGEALDDAARDRLVGAALAAEHRPERRLDLATEHTLSLEAIANAQAALRRVYAIAFDVAREAYPDDWLEFTPKLLTIATWVGYDLDGRSDIAWSETLQKRLIVQCRQLIHYRDTVRRLARGLTEAEALRHILELIETRLDLAIRAVEGEIEVFAHADPDPAAWAQTVSNIARRMHADRDRRLVDAAHLIELVERALARACTLDDAGATATELAILRAELANFGFGMAHTHVRLNATQLHNAIRKSIGMEAAPDDPSYRRSYVASVNALLDDVEPVKINFGSLLAERASAKRLFMVIAQIAKYVDATTPVRFLIAECETPLTLLTALYYARLFGVDKWVEISPLFETRKALERAPRVIDEILANPHYRAYVQKIGRLCVQTGYSDAGRYLGQTVAGASIERMRMRIGEVFARHKLDGVELLIFDTHGESIGRGAHPASFADRLRYVSPPESRARFARDGTAFKQETSFQGGDGYAHFFTETAAFASVTRVLEFALTPPDEPDDPFYDEADYIAEFFTSIQFFNDRVMEDPNYAALLSAFGTNWMYPTGSRSLRRQHEGRPVDVASPKQLRAIPHNATLQQLGFFANTVSGVGQAIAKNPVQFREMHATSPRFRRVFGMVAWALAFSDIDVLKAYTDTLDPGLWLLRATQRLDDRERFEELRRIAEFIEGHAHHDRLAGILRTLEADLLDMLHELTTLEADEGLDVHVPAAMTEDLRLLHALRVALIHRIFFLATHIPEFSQRHDITPEELNARILHLDMEGAIEALGRIFPQTETTELPTDFGETATYEADTGQSYAQLHTQIFEPMAKLYELTRRTSTGIDHIVGAMG